ncbi:GMC family oxidoreductase [Polyangium aurulentum]|uniref:GMC family oxidoreductase n=1 Tax=Polyangium aurulentum TaxID=2567896 RepID=UPI0010AE1631|nr:GMC family oxidoreductase [Polyangium aurulentum]UQA60039.1 GMC family oxidoreductase [Polyangium aurulentum]
MVAHFDPLPSVLTRPTANVGIPANISAAPPPANQGQGPLSSREIDIITAIAEVAMPAGQFLEGAGRGTADAMNRWMADIPPEAARVIQGSAWAIELSTLPTRRRPFSALPLEARVAALSQWEQSRVPSARALLRALLTPLKFSHFDRPEMFRHVGCHYELETVRDEAPPRWMSQVTDGREVTEDLDLECEVVVIGTGAGGAAAAYELASRGRAVLLLEEGHFHRRSSFTGRRSRAYKELYRDKGLTVALGNVNVPVWAGRAVGGSTVVNSGTCYRAPERTFEYWRTRHGLPSAFSAEGLSPYYERVEAMLGVSQASPLHLGKIAGIIGKGADHLGLSHKSLMRNAPGCDGQGICCFGCPTGAKRSTDVSYVPAALARGAQLVTAARVDIVEIVAGRARGVTATLGGPERGGRAPRLRVKAEAVVVAGGALMTPLLLRRSGACQTSGMLGKNLSIHPASKVMALFDDRVDQDRGIPQSYTIDQFAEEGLLFEGGSLPFDVAALGMPWTGKRFIELMERYPHLATFGFMIQDHSRGEVLPGPGGRPILRYNMNERDARLMQRGVETLCGVFQAAGARRVLPFVAGHDEVSTKDALARLRNSKVRPGDIEVTAFHPLGTCRVGTDPRRSCLGPDHEAHDVAGLYVCDGSAIPSSLGVNPQMTIMAMALRAAEIIDSRLP